jgi:hypothetical protein
MMRGHMWTGALLVSLLAAAPAAAIVIYERGPGLNLSVVDNGYNGTPGSMRCDDLTIADPGSISSVVLRLGMSHTWVSDLVVKLRSPSSTLVTVLSRPGLAETVDDGTPEFGGDSSNLVFASRISFDQASVNSAESMGGTIGDNEVVCQDDAICIFSPIRVRPFPERSRTSPANPSPARGRSASAMPRRTIWECSTTGRWSS